MSFSIYFALNVVTFKDCMKLEEDNGQILLQHIFQLLSLSLGETSFWGKIA